MPVVVVGWFGEKSYSLQLHGISESLSRYGLAENRDYRFEYHQVRSQPELEAVLARHAGAPFVIYSANTSPAEFVIKSRTRVPHVFLTYSDPLADGWIQSYAQPGGTATGVVEFAPVHGKRLDLLRDLVPSAQATAIVLETNSASDVLDASLAEYSRAHPHPALKVFRVATGEAVDSIARRLRESKIDSAYVPLVGDIDRVVQPALEALARARVPAISERKADVRRGAVMALEVDRDALFERVAHQIALVLENVPPGTIPVQSPRKFLLTVNLDAAKRIGIDVPRSLLLQAEVVIADGR